MSQSIDEPAEKVDLDMNISDGQTEIIVSGDRDTSVIVRSKSGEKIYLPPEDFDRDPEDMTPYDSPYDAGSGAEEGAYQTHPDANTTAVKGLQPTADGYRIVHPEPVTDLRFLR